jgi:hypothetical protein
VEVEPEVHNEGVLQRMSILRLQRRLKRTERLRASIPYQERLIQNLERQLGVLREHPKKLATVKRKLKTNREKLEACKIELREIIRRNHYLSADELIEVEQKDPLLCEKQPESVYRYERGNDPIPLLEEEIDGNEGGGEGRVAGENVQGEVVAVVAEQENEDGAEGRVAGGNVVGEVVGVVALEDDNNLDEEVADNEG